MKSNNYYLICLVFVIVVIDPVKQEKINNPSHKADYFIADAQELASLRRLKLIVECQLKCTWSGGRYVDAVKFWHARLQKVKPFWS